MRSKVRQLREIQRRIIKKIYPSGKMAKITRTLPVNLPKSYPRVSEPFIMTLGGIGDLIISIAASLSMGKIKILAAGHNNLHDIFYKFAECFSIPCECINMNEFEEYSKCLNCKSICHLPPGRNYADWRSNWEKYRYVSQYYSFKDMFEKIELDFPIIVIQPASAKNRKLDLEDYHGFIYKFITTHHIFAIGLPWQREIYNINDPHFHWLTFENEYCQQQIKENSIRRMLSIIGSSEAIFGIDSWLKTYGCYAEKSTTCFSCFTPQSDIFTNPGIWNTLQLKDIKDFI
jgi:hypothetical protein